MDILAAHRLQPAPAAAHLGITTSQLIKMLKDEPHAFVEVNTRRLAASQSRLK